MRFARRLCVLLTAVVLISSLSGCATILSKRQYEVTVDNSGGPTYFTVQDRKNQIVDSGITPHRMTLNASERIFFPAKYKIDFASQGGVQTRDLNAKVDPWIAGNILIGGVPGLAVDAATGAMWRLDTHISGQVPQHLIVSNVEQGSAVIAGRSQSPQPGYENPAAGYNQQKVQSASHTTNR